VVKVHLTEGLSLRGHSQISLETVGVQDWDESLDRVQWRARFGNIFGDVTSSTCENSVDRGNAICRRLNLDVVDRFQQTGRGLSCNEFGKFEGLRACEASFDLPRGNLSSKPVVRWE
jgi:hypothetical protein